jgi:glycerol kinase
MTNKKYILSLDQGTTSSRAIIFNYTGDIVSMSQKEFTQHFPQPGWVEHDPTEIWNTQLKVAKEAIQKANLNAKDIAAIGITNQRETTIVWDRETGKPIYNAIVWQDRRTSEFCDKLKEQSLTEIIRNKTGLIIDAYFSGSKIKWILDNVKGAREKANQGKLTFGTIDSWLIWNLTKGKKHITDITNASRTMLFNIHTEQWDKELLEILAIPESMLPKVVSSSEVVAETDKDIFFNPIPISGIAGDQQAASFGQMCLEEGMIKNTYGTGCFIVLNTGNTPIKSKNNLLTTILYKMNNKTAYALEGSIFIGGAVVQWLRDGLGIIKNSAEIEKLAKTEKDNGGVYLVPAFTGLGAPHWNQNARGTLIGLTRGTTAGHIARAALESIAYQTMDVLEAMKNDSNLNIQELRVDGGASKNNQLMQFQSNLINNSVTRPQTTETTALGAAYLAGLAVSYWDNIKDIQNNWQIDKIFEPNNHHKIKELYKDWQRAIKRSKNWAEK